ncbi:MAG: hypothetical protein AAGA11_04710 [Pseudomonadota bacterium]
MDRSQNRGAAGCVLGAMLLLTGCATSPPSRVDDLCRIFHEKPDWHAAAVAAQRAHGAPVALQMAVIQQESNFRHDVRAPRKRVFFGLLPGRRISSAFGYSQALDGTWLAYVDDTGVRGARRDHFDDAVDFVSWYLDQSRRRNGVPFSDTVGHYFNYHEGWGGYARKTYNDKAWLKRVAQKVANRRAQYARQLAQCELPPPGFWQRLFSGGSRSVLG